MKTKYIIPTLLLLITLSCNTNSKTNPKKSIDTTSYVLNENEKKEVYQLIAKKTTEKGYIPFEGINARIIMDALPKIKESDFHNIKTAKGIYTFDKELKFKMNPIDNSVPQTSELETSIKADQMNNLLSNIYKRLKKYPKSFNQVVKLIYSLN